MFDYHVHSLFSADCEQELAPLIEHAISKGLYEICITDHIDYDYNDPSIVFEFDIKKHKNAIDALTKKYKGIIEIKRGVELGMQPHVLDRCKTLVDSNGFDFVLASVHECEKKDFYIGDFFEGRSPDESFRVYLNELLSMVKTFDKFSVLGHLDIPKRYSTGIAKLDMNLYRDQVAEIFKVIIARNQGIEINTSGLRQNVGKQFPDYGFVSLYREMGGEIITIGSDSHVQETLCANFDDVITQLKQIGFTHVHGFSKMQPYEIKI